MTPLLSVENLVRRFPLGPRRGGLAALLGRGGGHRPLLHAVDGVSFSLGAGESLGLVGESGCGKSTLVNLLARLTDPDSGAIHLEGRDLAAIPARRFAGHPARGRIQVVFQDPHDSLNPRFTAFDSIAEPLRRLGGFSGAALTGRVTGLAERVGLPGELLGRFPHQLSGGQKARVNIGRAIALEPRLLILDEPTSALDVSVQAVILKLLARLRSELGMSYLFVSHDLNVVRLLCDRVLVMYLGQIVEAGPAQAVFSDPAHPYTRALVSAIPGPHAGHRAQRLRLDGEPRSPVDPDPHSCRLQGRCPRGETRCGREVPALRPVGEGHYAACHFAAVRAVAAAPAAQAV